MVHQGVEGVYGFLGRVWRLIMEEQQDGSWRLAPTKLTDQRDAGPDKLQRSMHLAIQKVTDDLEKLKFNTAISALMVLVNDLTKEPVRPRAAIETLLLLLAPFAPHIAEELWSELGHTSTLTYEPWPKAESRYLIQESLEIPVQVNGKLRGVVTVPTEADQETVTATAKEMPVIASFLEGKTIRKVIFVKGKLLNFVVG